MILKDKVIFLTGGSTGIGLDCVFLISDKARFVTGHIMHVSGGAEIGYRH
jgi:NAD(P)-dependent dehydrogenase (short-subunit alcohol dehydrogenase family)